MAATIIRFHLWDQHLSSKRNYIIYQNAVETLEPVVTYQRAAQIRTSSVSQSVSQSRTLVFIGLAPPFWTSIKKQEWHQQIPPSCKSLACFTASPACVWWICGNLSAGGQGWEELLLYLIMPQWPPENKVAEQWFRVGEQWMHDHACWYSLSHENVHSFITGMLLLLLLLITIGH